MKDKRRLISVGVVLAVLLVLGGIYLISKGIVGRSYSAVDYVESRNGESNKQSAPAEATLPDKEFVDDSNLSRAKCIYDSSDLISRQKDYLDVNYATYKDVLNSIEQGAREVCSTIHQSAVSDSDSILKLHGAGALDSLKYEDIKGFSAVSAYNVFTAIGLCNDTMVVCAYNYPNNKDKFLVCIDYSEHSFLRDTEKEVYEFGSRVNAFIIPSAGVLKTYGDWSVLYVKG